MKTKKTKKTKNLITSLNSLTGSDRQLLQAFCREIERRCDFYHGIYETYHIVKGELGLK